jgi:hypothetical protein
MIPLSGLGLSGEGPMVLEITLAGGLVHPLHEAQGDRVAQAIEQAPTRSAAA